MAGFLFWILYSFSVFAYLHTIVVDAGSTGSRASIFEIGKKVQWKETCQDDEAGGIQNLATHSHAERYLDTTVKCIQDYFIKIDKPTDYQAAKVRLMATGGVRSIPPKAQKQVLAKVSKYFRTKGFNDFKAEVLTGEREGVYAWIAINYLSETLGKEPAETIGVLDMGGASTQIAFVPEKTPRKHRFPLEIAGKKYQLYTYSYDGFGVNLFARKYAPSACFQRDLEKDKTVLNEVGLAKKLSSENPATGNYEACKKEILRHLKETCTEKSFCGLKDVYQPPINGNFVAIAGYAHFILKKSTKKIQMNLNELEEIGKTLCQKGWYEYKALALDKPKYSLTACIEPAFYSSILFGHPQKIEGQDGFGFDHKKEVIRTAFQIDGVDLSWTLGAAIYLSEPQR